MNRGVRLATRREYVHIGSYAASMLHRVAKRTPQFMPKHRLWCQ